MPTMANNDIAENALVKRFGFGLKYRNQMSR
jgi:hypothetical protein